MTSAAEAAAAQEAANDLSVDPFTLGVASGEPTSDGVVLWTRLAVKPLASDGKGGMRAIPYPVSWQIATDEELEDVVDRGVELAFPEQGHSVHVEVGGLAPNKQYWYRFRVGRFSSRIARTRTAPAPSALPDELRLCFVSCSQYEHGYFGVYRSVVADEPDIVLHLGDYIYEYEKGEYNAPSGNVRDHVGPHCRTLANYRQRYAQYKTDDALQNAHAAAPWLVVFDDHEVANDWRADKTDKPEDQPGFVERRAAAFQAYYENMPLRPSSRPDGPDMQVYRRAQWGQLATFHLLDTRQYASPNACGGGYHSDCAEAADPERSITGGAQERWLLDGFATSRARWDLISQQTHYARRDADEGPAVSTNMDTWDGYLASRDRVTRGWRDAKVRNPVVLSGDVHAHWASDLKIDYDDPESETVGAELVTSSITSTGDGKDSIPEDHPYLKINKHLRFYNNLRGYVRAIITPDRMDVDFRCLPYVSRKGADPFTRRSFAVDDGKPGLRQTGDNPPATEAASLPAAWAAEIRQVIDQETKRP